MQYSLTLFETVKRSELEETIDGRPQQIQLGRLTGPYVTLEKVAMALIRADSISTSLNVIVPLDRGYAHIPEERFVDAFEQYQADKRSVRT